MKRENRYVVIKRKDIDKYLPDEMRRQLGFIIKAITHKRAIEDKKPIDCVVVESDWPMYEETWQEIEQWVHEQVTIGAIEDTPENRNTATPSPWNMRTG